MLIYAQAAETEAKAKGKAKLNRRPAWQLLITFCVGVRECVCVSCMCMTSQVTDNWRNGVKGEGRSQGTAELAKRK